MAAPGIDWSETNWPLTGAALGAMACLGVAIVSHDGLLTLLRPEGWGLDLATIALAVWAAWRGGNWWMLLVALPAFLPLVLLAWLLLACSMSAACL